MNAFMIITFVLFTALVAVISYVKTKGEDTTTKEGYFLAGRGLPAIVICGSLLMTNISAEQLVGQNGQSYIATIGVFGWEIIAAFALVLCAMCFLPKFIGNGITTIPQFYEMRYGTAVRRLAAIGFMVYYVVAMLPLVLYAGSVVLEQLFGISEMFGAILSSFNSVLNSASTIFAMDIYTWIKPKADDETVVRASKTFGTIVAIIAIAISPFIMFFGQGIQAFLNESMGYILTPLFVMAIFGVTKIRVPQKACFVMLVVHFVLYAIGLNTLTPAPLHSLYVLFFCFVVDMIIMFAASKIAPSPEVPDLTNPSVDLTPWKYAKFASGLVVCLIIALYAIFSPLFLGA